MRTEFLACLSASLLAMPLSLSAAPCDDLPPCAGGAGAGVAGARVAVVLACDEEPGSVQLGQDGTVVIVTESGDHVLAPGAQARAIQLADGDLEELEILGKVPMLARRMAYSGGGAHGITLIETDGDVKVTVNGQPVPADRIKRDGGKITILGEDGTTIFEFGGARGAAMAPGDALHRFSYPGVQGKQRRIGISMVPVDTVLCEHLDLDPEAVVMVGEVHEGMPASEAGLEAHDIITHLNGRPGVTMASLKETVQETAPGEMVRLRFLRRGMPLDVAVVVKETQIQGAGQMQWFQDKDIVAGPRARLLLGNGEAFGDPDSSVTLELMEKVLETADQREAASSGHEQAIRRLEERLERLENLLERLIQQRERR